MDFKNKILVHFRKEKVVSITEHRGSKEYNKLIQDGYEEVGTSKGGVFIVDKFFNPKDKYQRDETAY